MQRRVVSVQTAETGSNEEKPPLPPARCPTNWQGGVHNPDGGFVEAIPATIAGSEPQHGKLRFILHRISTDGCFLVVDGITRVLSRVQEE